MWTACRRARDASRHCTTPHEQATDAEAATLRDSSSAPPPCGLPPSSSNASTHAMLAAVPRRLCLHTAASCA
eukprot:7382763-Prymnesium_polylepis.1